MKTFASLPVKNNVIINVIDRATGKIVQSAVGHNECTNSMLVGVAHYLVGDGVLNQGYDNSVLSAYVPKYISLGTMGLLSQESDANGLPKYIGDTNNPYGYLPDEEHYPSTAEEIGELYDDYASKAPGFGADGYSSNLNNGREYFGLGRVYATVTTGENAVDCELIAPNFPRAKISHREIVAETQSEQSKTIDVVFSAMVSVGALAQFRGDNDYIFITECGLWAATPQWQLRTKTVQEGDLVYQQSYYTIDDFWDTDANVYNSLLAGYRMIPTSVTNRAFTAKSVKDQNLVNPYTDSTKTELKTIEQIDAEAEALAAENRGLLKQTILRVGPNQVVQVVWKVQLGDLAQLGTGGGSSIDEAYIQQRINEALDAELNVDSDTIIVEGSGF